MGCVNISSKEFKQLADKNGISSSTLELITHKYWIETKNEDSFPSNIYIQANLGNSQYMESGKAVRQLWEKKYKTPREFNNMEDLKAFEQEALKFFPANAIVHYRNGKNTFSVVIKEPVAKLSKDKQQELKKDYVLNQEDLNLEEQKIYTTDKLEQLFDKFNTDRTNKNLANKVFNLAKQLGINVYFNEKLPQTSKGRYTNNNSITLRKSFLESNAADNQKANVILHELLHAATMYALSDQTENWERTPQLESFRTEINSIFQDIQFNKTLKGERGVTNIFEFVAELSNPIFRNKLQKIEEKNIWQRIKNAILNFLGINTNSKYYNRAVQAMENALNAFDLDAYIRYNNMKKLFYVDSPNINTDISTEQKRELVKSIVNKNTEQTPVLEKTEDQKKWIEDNKEQLLEDYINTNGNKFDPDRVREMLIPIGYNKHNLSTYYAAGRYLSDFIKQRMFETLANSSNKTVTILTGTPGSGKSFATKNRKAEFDKRGVLFDSAFHSIEELQEVVNVARNAGVKDENIQVVAVYNDLATTFKNSVTRGKNQNGEDYGRFLPIKYFIESFTKNQGKISALLDNNPNIQVVTIDNSNNQGKEVSNDEARQWDYSVNEEQIESLIKLIINDNEIQESKRKELIERVFNEGIGFQDIQRLAEVSEENRKDGTRRIRQLFRPEIRSTFGNQLGIESQEETSDSQTFLDATTKRANQLVNTMTDQQVTQTLDNIIQESADYDLVNPSEKETQFAVDNKANTKTFTFNDGVTVHAPFTPNQQQVQALNAISDFIKSRTETAMTLSGYAGTGKTSLMQMIAEKQADAFGSRIVFSASTNKAAAVLKSKVKKQGYNAFTLNRVFGISVEVDQSKSYDVSKLIKAIRDNRMVQSGDIVVIDEASMINDEDYDLLCDIAKGLGAKIIFLGDAAQLAPVNQDKLSKVFSNQGRVVELTQVERTGDNAILAEATALRNGQPLSKESSFNSQGQGVAYVEKGNSQTIDKIIDKFIPELEKNPDFFRILAYTNKTITEYNEKVRSKLGYKGNIPHVGEPIMGYSNWGWDRKNNTYEFINSESYKVTNVESPRTENFTTGDLTVALEVTPVTLKDSLGEERTYDFLEIKQNQENRKAAEKLALVKSQLWDRYRRARGFERGDIISEINKIDKFLFVNDDIVKTNANARPVTLQKKLYDFGYAMTIHKSQGSTFTNVLIDDTDIQAHAKNSNVRNEGPVANLNEQEYNYENATETTLEEGSLDDEILETADSDTKTENQSDKPNLKQQLRYVAVSRATDTATIISTGVKSEDSPLNHLQKKAPTPAELIRRKQEVDDMITAAEHGITTQLVSHLRTILPEIYGTKVFNRENIIEYLKNHDYRKQQMAFEAEMQSIKQKAEADGTFMKAPNGKPTNLTERQWLQVRTKAFKDWFGDWEAVHEAEDMFNLDAVDNSKVDIEEVDKPWRDDPSKSNKTVRIYLKGQHEKGYFELVKDIELGQYSVHFKTSKPGAKFSSSETVESTKEERKTLFKELVKAIPDGAIVSTWGSLSQEGIKGLNNVGREMTKIGERDATLKTDGSHIKIPIFQKGKRKYTIVTTKETVNKDQNWVDGSEVIKENGKFYYTNELGRKKEITEKEYEDFNKGLDIILSEKTHNERVRDDYSRVLDKNGEPLVMYHITPADDIKIFDKTKSRHGGFWFSSNPNYYVKDALNRSDITAIPVFLNIKTPNEIPHNTFLNAVDGDLFSESLSNTRFDGWITRYIHEPEFSGDTYSESVPIFAMATSPNQIKSATGNIGTFSRENDDIRYFIGKKARTKFEQQLHKMRPDMSDVEIQATLNLLHLLKDEKENNAYIRDAVRWIANGSLNIRRDQLKARQAFDEARKRRIDTSKFKTLGELIVSPEMQPKKKGKKEFDPDKASTFSNKRTVTTESGREFTVYDVENTEEGQREVCKALAAHYSVSPWCLSTFTATGEPTQSAKNYWELYSVLPRKIAFENGKPVAFNSDKYGKSIAKTQFRGTPIIVQGMEALIDSTERGRLSRGTVDVWKQEGLVTESTIAPNALRLTEKAKREIYDTTGEAWWDMEDRLPQDRLSDSIVNNSSKMDRTTEDELTAKVNQARLDIEQEVMNNFPKEQLASIRDELIEAAKQEIIDYSFKNINKSFVYNTICDFYETIGHSPTTQELIDFINNEQTIKKEQHRISTENGDFYQDPFTDIDDPFANMGDPFADIEEDFNNYDYELTPEDDVFNFSRAILDNELSPIIENDFGNNLLTFGLSTGVLTSRVINELAPYSAVTDFLNEHPIDGHTTEDLANAFTNEIYANLIENGHFKEEARNRIWELIRTEGERVRQEENRIINNEDDDFELPFYLTPEGEVYGFLDKQGNIYLDETVIKPEHPIHEYTHLWDRAVQQRQPKLWSRGVGLMKQTSLWNQILADTNYGQKWKEMGITGERLNNLIASEVHARFVGEGGQKLLNDLAKEKGQKGIIAKLKQWILDVWKALGKTFGTWSDEALNNLTLKDFNHLTMRDFAMGTQLKESTQETQTNNQQQTTTPVFTTSKGGYRNRTIENVTSSDVTISLFEKKSPGEILTGNQARRQNKYAEEKDMTWNIADIPGRVSQTVKIMPKTDNITLNIAGNGIYDINATQEQVNNYLTEYLRELRKQGVTIKKVISGGQTGVDQAGIIAAQRLGIPSEVHAPSDFSFRGKDGKDVRGNEQLFKERFNQQQQSQNNTANQSTQAIEQERTKINEIKEVLGDNPQTNTEIKDTVKVAKQGKSFEKVLSEQPAFFSNEEIQQIKQALNGKNLRVMSVSRKTDPVFFSQQIVDFLKENAKKALSDPTRVQAIEIWSKHDGMPIKNILDACNRYRVAPMVSFSITGLGNTALEKGVMRYQDMLQKIGELIGNGTLNPTTTTIRIDPILVGVTNMQDIKNIVQTAKQMGIKKFVTSLVQSYGYLENTANDRKVISGINQALASEGKTYDWEKYYGRDYKGRINFKPKQQYINEVGKELLELDKDPEITIQTCAFTIEGLKSSACLDPLIIERLVGVDVTSKDGKYVRDTSRPECMCYGCHGDFFKTKPQCESSCAYCYAAHSEDSPFQYYNEDGSLIDSEYTRTSENVNTQKTPIQQDMSSETFYDRQSANEYIQDMIDAGVPKEQIKIEYTKAEGDFDQYWTVSYPTQQNQKQVASTSTSNSIEQQQTETQVNQQQNQVISLPGYEFLTDNWQNNQGTVVDAAWKIPLLQELENQLNITGNQEDNYNIVRQMDQILQAQNKEELTQTESPKAKKENEIEHTLNEYDKLIQQIDNLLDSEQISASEIRHVAELVVNAISDNITELKNNPELVKKQFPANTSELDFANASRKEIVQAIGLGEFIERAKNLFHPQQNNYQDLETLTQAYLITDNWDAIMYLAADVFAANEGFGLRKSMDNGKYETAEEMNLGYDNFNQASDIESIEEEYGDAQEHWQVESRTIDVLNSMSAIVRQAIHECYLTDEKGQKVYSKWGIAERINPRNAVNSILRWTQGALSLNDMIQKLMEKSEKHTWLNQLIERLSDTSGKNTDFQGQFFGVFCKHFQKYSIVLKDDNKYHVMVVNEKAARAEAYNSIVAQFQAGEHTLFNINGVINTKQLGNKQTVGAEYEFNLHKALSELQAIESSLNQNQEMTPEMTEKAINNISGVCKILGYPVPRNIIAEVANSDNLAKSPYERNMVSYLQFIVKALDAQVEEQKKANAEKYDPFKFKGKNSIEGSLKNFLAPITDVLEDTSINAFFDSGKMYQSYITPSFLTKLMNKFRQTGESFEQFILEEYGQSEWFREQIDKRGPLGQIKGWKNVWLEMLANNTANARSVFDHKVELNFDKHNYMKDMDDLEYTLSLITEYYAEKDASESGLVPAWFKMPMMSNKPSSEFIKFFSYRGNDYKQRIIEGLYKMFLQEIGRIRTVRMRNLKKSDPRFISSFDTNGKMFSFLPFLNSYLDGKSGNLLQNETSEGNTIDGNKEFAKLLMKKINGTELMSEEETALMNYTKEAIGSYMENRVNNILKQWEQYGILKAAESIEKIGWKGTVNEDIIKDSVENFLWNDYFAAKNILQLTIGDTAFYKNTEDLQKRLAQLHAPGIRGNINAVDYQGKRVSDGKYRTLLLEDFEDYKANIIDNIAEVFDRKINVAQGSQKQVLQSIKESLVGENGVYRTINVTDAQGLLSPSAYRKKAFMFGKWSTKAEDIYQKLLKGEYTYSDLQTAFQPLKPFVYSRMMKDMGVENAPIHKMMVPFQAKNSEYLLIMADAIIRGEENTSGKLSRPNLLRAIFRVMEDSAYDRKIRNKRGELVNDPESYNGKGIDTVQFQSAIKSGLQAPINIHQFMDMEGGEEAAYSYITSKIYKQQSQEQIDNKAPREYEVDTYVQELSYEDFCLQQEVPAHFANHEQAHGSQIRMIIPSDLEFYRDPNGDINDENNKVYYEWTEPDGTKKKLTPEQYKKEYENNIAENIQESLDNLREEFHLNSLNKKEKNTVLSKILIREILSSPRYGVDLAQACTVDKETGEFRIPKGDPIQGKRIEQLINSIIKKRVNKQEIAGGPIVQVTNFGTSKQLNIKFKDKQGNLLKTRNEFEGTNEEFKNYIKENQAGIAYFEAYAPIWSKELFEKFADKNGNINIEAVKKTDPELLKMISYRIPTEDKYSTAPTMIVGFMPREAGDAIMLPWELTAIDGSDFDVDKRYVMRKLIEISKKRRSEVQKEMINFLKEDYQKKYGKKMPYETKQKLREEINMLYDKPEIFRTGNNVEQELYRIYQNYAFKTERPTQGKAYRDNKIIDMTWAVLTHELMADKVFNPGGFEEPKRMGYMVAAFKNKANTYSWEQLENMTTDQLKKLSYEDKDLAWTDTQVQFYKQNSAAASLIGVFAVNKVAHATLENNEIYIAVNEICGPSAFTIGNTTFEGVMEIDKTRDSLGNIIGKTMASLVAASVDAVKDPILNLMNINMSTANILNTLIRLGMPFDEAALFLSQSAIEKVLMEFNQKSLEKYETLDNIINENLKQLNDRWNITTDSNIETEQLSKQELVKGLKEVDTEDEMEKQNKEVIDYKVLRAFQKVKALADNMKNPTFATRFNSISAAVGPLVIDNIILEDKKSQFMQTPENPSTHFYTKNALTNEIDVIVDIEDIFKEHPILEKFAEALDIAKDMLKDMPTSSQGFKNLLNAIPPEMKTRFYGDKKMLDQLAMFYQSYMLVDSGLVDNNSLKEMIEQFPKKFIKENIKEKYADNELIQAIQPNINKKSKRTYLKINITGMDTAEKEKLSNAWVDLYKKDPKLSKDLFIYNFFRGGIGFNPKTFISLLPVYVKERLSTTVRGIPVTYVDTYNTPMELDNYQATNLFRQFIQNNWNNYKLVPKIDSKEYSYTVNMVEGTLETTNPDSIRKLKDVPYMKTKDRNTRQTILWERKIEDVDSNGVIQKITYEKIDPLGNNGEYIEFVTTAVQTPVTQTTQDVADINSSTTEDSEIKSNGAAVVEENAPIQTTLESPEQLARQAVDIADILMGKQVENGNEQVTDSKVQQQMIEQRINESMSNKGIVVNEEEAKRQNDEIC